MIIDRCRFFETPLLDVVYAPISKPKHSTGCFLLLFFLQVTERNHAWVKQTIKIFSPVICDRSN